MGRRLTRITTRTGDDGTTGLADGSRVRKDDPRVEALGAVDELNAALGLVLAESPPDDVAECLIDVQHRLFDLGAGLCQPGSTRILPAHVDALDAATQRFNDGLPALREFVLPGGTRGAAACHLARTVARRAERRLVALAPDAGGASSLAWLNRLSDLLFVLSRVLNRGRAERQWQTRRDGV